MSRIIAVFAFFLLISSSSFAQSLASTPSTSTANLLGFGNDQWSFYHNSDDNTVFIDFSTIDVNLHDIKLIDSKGKVLVAEPLFDLPVDTIYELDLTGLMKGEYMVELHTYSNEVIRRKLQI